MTEGGVLLLPYCKAPPITPAPIPLSVVLELDPRTHAGLVDCGCGMTEGGVLLLPYFGCRVFAE
ncbi:hypothetical protein CPT32_17510 [Rhizobium sophoriradicis]|nr:hypothetical protein CPT32_17510 [Rhizobium sophoriradicis]